MGQSSVSVPKLMTTKVISIDNQDTDGEGTKKLENKEQLFYIKRTITEGPNKTIQRIEIITDPEEVHTILQKQKRQGTKTPRIYQSDEEDLNRINMRKEKRRLQEQYRREKKKIRRSKIITGKI